MPDCLHFALFSCSNQVINLFARRCEAFRLLYETKNDEKISYMDINSLYPSILRGTPGRPFPTGVPEIITRDFRALDSYFGIAHVRVIAPKDLQLPILPFRCVKKIYYALCRSCVLGKQMSECSHDDADRYFDGIFTTPELQLAVRHGYRILRFYEVWHYASSSYSLFTSFIDRFYQLKVQNSGWPKTCRSFEQKTSYLNVLAERYNIILQPDDVRENPTQRLIAKIMLNSSWVSRFYAGLAQNEDNKTFVSP